VEENRMVVTIIAALFILLALGTAACAVTAGDARTKETVSIRAICIGVAACSAVAGVLIYALGQ
jgi:hypothetical protein